MSAARPSSDPARSQRPHRHTTRPPRDMSQLRSRRRAALRRRRLLRVDVGLGLLGAIVLLLATPGLAIAALFALILVVLCVASVLLERRQSRRRTRVARERRD